MHWTTLAHRYLIYIYTIIKGGITWYITRHFTVRKPKDDLLPMTDIDKISSRVTLVLGQNPGPFTLQGTNTYLVGKGEKLILIDTGEPDKPRYIKKLREAVGTNRIVAIVCTHWHRDHIGGLEEVKEAYLCDSNVPVYKLGRTDGKSEPPGFTIVPDGHVISTDDSTLRVVATRGHTSDHMALYLEEDKIIFSGDCVLGEGSSIFEDLSSYMASLHRLQTLDSKIICPGHGPVIRDPKQKLEEYVHHRQKREDQILAFLKTVERANALEVTRAVYSKLPKNVQIAAFRNIQQHLVKLEKDGVIRNIGVIDYAMN